jgi:hypothetical protein
MVWFPVNDVQFSTFTSSYFDWYCKDEVVSILRTYPKIKTQIISCAAVHYHYVHATSELSSRAILRHLNKDFVLWLSTGNTISWPDLTLLLLLQILR